jgi:leader peptidase (prepilin peptidase)/N-methyltransferase
MSNLGWLLEPAVLPWVAAAFGLCIGSFLNVVIHRLPKMMEREWLLQIPELLEDARRLRDDPRTAEVAGAVRDLTRKVVEERDGLVTPRSRCPSCGRSIRAVENIPLLSYLFLRGKCAGCSARISLQYPMVELLAGAGAMYCAYRFGFGLKTIAAAVFVWSVIALAWIDQAHGYLPDDITLPLMWIGLLVNVRGTFVSLDEAVLGAAVGYMVLWSVNAGFRTLRGIDGMGNGDFKMTAAVGAFLGWKPLFMVILLSSVVGLVFGCLQMVAARRGWDSRFKFHFGPYIAIAAIAAMFWGTQVEGLIPLLRPFP